MSSRSANVVRTLAFAILATVILAAVIPTPTADLGPRRRSVLGYDVAVRKIADIQNAERGVAAPGGGTALLTHGARARRAVLLLHGFSNSPRQFVALAHLLFDDGDNVFIPRLPRQAEKAADIRVSEDLSAEELRDATDQAVNIASGLGDTLVVAGLSLGGTLAAWTAQFRPEVHRAVIIAPALEIARVPELLAEPLVNLSTRAPNLTHRDAYDPSHPDRELGFTTRGVAQTLRVGIAVRNFARQGGPAVHDIAIVLNAHDATVKPAPALELARLWRRSARVSVYELPDSLALPHDVIDPTERGGRTAIVYPVVIALIHGEQPPPLW